MDEQTKYAALYDWFLSPQGKAIANAFAAELYPMHAFLSGRSVLQLGACGDNIWFKPLRFQQKYVVSPAKIAGETTIIASIPDLPLERESMDCVIAPLTMEAYAREDSPMDEIDRILKPMGYIIFFGVNPWSLWGAALHWQRVTCLAHKPASMYSVLSLKLAMISRGYRQCYLNSFYYIPPIKQQNWMNRLAFLNQMGKMMGPFPAGFYCLIMQKHDPDQPLIPCESLRNNFHFARV